MRDDRPFAGPDPPAAVFFYSRNRGGEHPARHLAGYAGILQADAYAGFGDLYDGRRRPGPITEAACWSHGRRHFFELADLRKAPLASEAVRRIDAIFAIEREINGRSAAERVVARQERIMPLVAELETWMRAERARLSRHAATAKAIDYMLKRWPAFTQFLDDGRICLSQQCRRTRITRNRNEASIMPPFFKPLKTLEVGFRTRRDTGDLFAQSRQSPVGPASRRPGFDTEPPARPARRKGCRR